MDHSQRTGYAGPLALAAGGLFIVSQLLMWLTLQPMDKQATVADPVFVLAQMGYFVGFVTLMLALIAAYGEEASEAGTIGLIAFGAAVVGTMFLAGDLWFDAFAGPWIIGAAPAVADAPSGTVVIGAFTSYVLFAAGWAAFGLASLRARVFPVAISVAIVIGGLIGFLALVPPFGIPLGATMIGLGVWCLRAPVAAVDTSPTPA